MENYCHGYVFPLIQYAAFSSVTLINIHISNPKIKQLLKTHKKHS